MQIFDYPICRRRCRGFTLIEILVVLFIVTVLAGLAVSRLPGFVRAADLDNEMRRVELLLDMARTEAILDSVEFGFRLSGGGYGFERFDDRRQRWEEAEKPFHARDVPDDLRLYLHIDKKVFLLSGEKLPPVLILSSGETTPFSLVMESRLGGGSRTLTGDAYGGFEWRADE